MMSAEKKSFDVMPNIPLYFSESKRCVDFKARGSKANYANLSYKCIDPMLIRAV